MTVQDSEKMPYFQGDRRTNRAGLMVSCLSAVRQQHVRENRGVDDIDGHTAAVEADTGVVHGMPDPDSIEQIVDQSYSDSSDVEEQKRDEDAEDD